MPELYETRIIPHSTHVINSRIGYDMIIGMNLLGELGIDILNSTHSIKWDTSKIPMKARNPTINHAYFITDPPVIHEATKRQTQILDTKYGKANLSEVVQD